jgi:CheY-like chemotaxis protein
MKPKRTILCVDDNEQSLSIRKVMLETRGYRVIACTTGEEALERFKSGGVDLVLTDLIMPGLDGIAATRAIRKDHPGVAVITYTSHTDTQYAELARAAGAATHLCKPFDFGLLQAQVSAAVAAQQEPGGDSA